MRLAAVAVPALVFCARVALADDALEVGRATRLEPGQSVRYTQALLADEFLQVVVEQQGADLELRILDPAGREVWYGDGQPTGAQTESAFWVARAAGPHELVIHNRGTTAGSALVTTVERRKAEPADRDLAAAEALLRQTELRRRDRSAKALGECVDMAREARRLLQGHRRRMAALAFLGLCSRDLGRLDEAQSAFEEALATARELGHAPSEAENLVYLGNVAGRRGDFPAALEFQLQAAARYAAIGRKGGEAFAWNNAANLQSQLGRNARAAESYEKAIAAFRAASDTKGEALARMNLGVMLSHTGRSDAALAALEEGLTGLRAAGNRTSEAGALNSMASLFGSLGDYERARTYAEQGLALRRELGDRRGQGLSHATLGELHLDTGAPKEAQRELMAATGLLRESKDKDGEAHSLYLLGRALNAQGAPGAPEAWRQALALRRETGAVKDEGWLLLAMAEAQVEMPDAAAARASLDEALALLRSAGDPHGEAHALYLAARLERAQGRRDEAIAHAQAAIEVAESVRARVASSELRATYVAKVRRYYELLLDLLLQAGAGPPDAAAVERAFAVSERARARALLDLFAFAAAGLDAGLDPELRRRRDDLRDAIAGGQAELVLTAGSAGRGASARKHTARRLEEAYEAYDLLAQEIRRRHPAYASVAHPEPTSLADARQLVDADTALLEYFVGESGSWLFVGESGSWLFVVDAGGIAVHRLPAVAALAPVVDELHAGLRQPSLLAFGRFARSAHTLYGQLLEPAAARLQGRRHLLIAPDGPLHRVPFEALLTARPTAAPDPRRLPYLVRRFSVRYVPSMGVLRRLDRSAGGPTLELIAVADPIRARPWSSAPGVAARRALLGDAPLPPLPGARREAQAIASLFPAPAVRLLMGGEATEANLHDAGLEAARYLHFATHALVSERRPDQSGLVLAAGGADDAFLQVHEVLGLRISADLVALSACSTGLGREVLGEGLLGLTQAFFAAGARSVMATLWPVTDDSSADLVVRFYRGLARGEGGPAALRRAKLALIGGQWAHPHHWAAYVLSGNAPPARRGPKV